MRFIANLFCVLVLLFLTYNPWGYSFVDHAWTLIQYPWGWLLTAIFAFLWFVLIYFVYISTRAVITVVVMCVLALVWYNLYHYQADLLFASSEMAIGIAYIILALGVAFCLEWPRIRRSVTGVHSVGVVEEAGSPETNDGGV